MEINEQTLALLNVVNFVVFPIFLMMPSYAQIVVASGKKSVNILQTIFYTLVPIGYFLMWGDLVLSPNYKFLFYFISIVGIFAFAISEIVYIVKSEKVVVKDSTEDKKDEKIQKRINFNNSTLMVGILVHGFSLLIYFVLFLSYYG